MAYCPKCKKQVEDRWVECPVCRTELVISKKGAVTVDEQAVKSVQKMDFSGRIFGVLKFDQNAFQDISQSKPIGEAVALYGLNLLISLLVSSTESYTKLLESLPGGMPLSKEALLATSILFGVAVALLGAVVTHLALRLLGGKADFMATLTLMLFISALWGVPFNTIYGILLGLSFPIVVLSVISIVLSVVILAAQIVGLAAGHELSRMKSLVAVVISYVVQFIILFFVVMTLSILAVLSGVPGASA